MKNPYAPDDHPSTCHANTVPSFVLKRLEKAVEDINDAVRHAVEQGMSVELVRVRRHHDGAGNWGDQLNVRQSVRGVAATTERSAG